MIRWFATRLIVRWNDQERRVMLVIDSLCRNGSQAYGVSIRKALLDEKENRAVGWIYNVIDRLEHRGLVSSRWVPGGPERGYRAKRISELTEVGKAFISKGPRA